MTRLSHQFSWLVVSRILGAVLQAVGLALLARSAGPASFGVTSGVLGVGVAISSSGDFGLGQYVMRVRARDRASPEVGAILRLAARTSAAVSVLFGAALLIASLPVPELAATVPLAAWAGFEKISNSWLAVATADGRSHINAISLVIRRGVAVVLFVVLDVVGTGPTLAFCASYAIAAALGALVTVRVLQADISRSGFYAASTLLQKSWPFWLNSAAGQARGLDVAIVAVFAGPVVAGIYSVPSKMMSPLRLLPDTLSMLIMTTASRDDRQAVRKLLWAASAVSFLLVLGLGVLAWFAEPLIGFLLGADFHAAALPFQLFCVGIAAASATSLVVGLLQGWGHERFVGIVDVYVTLALIAGAAMGSVLAGAPGAAIGVSLAYVLNLVVLAARVPGAARSLQTTSPAT